MRRGEGGEGEEGKGEGEGDEDEEAAGEGEEEVVEEEEEGVDDEEDKEGVQTQLSRRERRDCSEMRSCWFSFTSFLIKKRASVRS